MNYSKLAAYKDEYSDSGWLMYVVSNFDIAINCLLFFVMACSLHVVCLQGIMGVVLIKINVQSMMIQLP